MTQPPEAGDLPVTDIERLRRLLGEASKRPWRVKPESGKPTIASDRGGNLFRGYIATWQEADLIVAAVNALPGLLDELATLRSQAALSPAPSQGDVELREALWNVLRRHGVGQDIAIQIIAESAGESAAMPVSAGAFRLGDRVEKISGSAWHGIVVGTYSTKQTADGYAVESEREPGSVQIYPAKALRLSDDDGKEGR